MFSYYGSKSKIVNYYPVPKHGKIIEPFAGSARYALKWFDRDVLLVDSREVIVKTWHYLQQASPADILRLPEPNYKQSLDDFNLSEEERLLLGWICGRGATHPRRNAQKFAMVERDKKSIAGQLHKIKHWIIQLGDYQSIPNTPATWFIDPPYVNGGDSYRTKSIDYYLLAEWCKLRQGQVIVCENTKANWLPFSPLCRLHGAQSVSTEAIWCNDVAQLSFI